MASKQKWLHLMIVSWIILCVEARPNCRLHGEQQRDLVCTPGTTDYILRRGLVSDNNKTTGITLRGCRITGVGLEAFEALPELRYLDLSVNKIQRLKLGALDGTRLLTYLNLSHNMLSDFPLGLFDQKTNVDVLDLKENRLQTLELGILDPMSKLRHLDLSSNVILGKNLSPYIFDKSKRIEFMDFSKNDMTGSPENLLHAFRALNFLNLDQCLFEMVPRFATRPNLSTMKHLMLSSNQITKLDKPDTFVHLKGLEILNLAENQISNVHENVFKSLTKLKVIVLRNNQLIQIPHSLFQNLASLQNIDLSYNEIEFVPVNAFRGTIVNNLNLSHNKFTFLSDNFVLELRNSGAGVNKFYFNNNPWQCACLKQTLNEVKALGVKYNSKKYDGKVPVCVTTKEFFCKKQENLNEFYVKLYNDLIITV